MSDGFDLSQREEESIQQLRVEVTATLVLHHLDGRLDGQRGAVHLVAGQGVKDVGHRRNPRRRDKGA
jgi:hypothetical protein